MNNKYRVLIQDLSKETKVLKEKLIEIAQEHGIVIENKRMAKEKILELLADNNLLDIVYEEYKDTVYIPIWRVADYYGLYAEQISFLNNIKVIKEAPIEKEFYNSVKTKWRKKGYYSAPTYPISVLDYNKDDLKNALEKAFGTGFRTRIEVKTKEEAQEIIDELSKLFEVTTGTDIYEKRDIGYHCYVSLRKLNNSEFEKNRFLHELEQSELKIKEIKEECKLNIKANEEDILYHLEINKPDDISFSEAIIEFIVDFKKIKRENEKLKKLLQKNNIEF